MLTYLYLCMSAKKLCCRANRDTGIYIYEAEAQAFDPRHPSDVAEVVNYVDAMKRGLAR